jgi:hypothetical protein
MRTKAVGKKRRWKGRRRGEKRMERMKRRGAQFVQNKT